MNNFILLLLFFLHFACISPSTEINIHTSTFPPVHTSEGDSIPEKAKKILKFYPMVIGYSDGYLHFTDGSKMIFDDGRKKSESELLNSPDVEDMFAYDYKNWNNEAIPKNYDSGRIRVDSFFMKVYGQTKTVVQSNLVKVKWCPKLVNQDIYITRVNGVNLKIDSISKELDQLPQFTEYLRNIGGTFNWRQISGTNRLSMHSFGMTVDINTKFSNYWQWDCNCKNEGANLEYKNKIPLEIVKVFEKYGFIWGGNWYHYDTMHFEYRPELLH